MTILYELLIAPIIDYPFMKRALLASIMVAFASGITGVFLVMKRMSLAGDALSHGILPGIALGFVCFGFSLPAMSIGGMIAGIIIAFCSFLATKHTNLKEDASFAAFYLISLAVGVIIITKIGSQADLIHILFGSVLAVDQGSLIFIWIAFLFTLITLAIIYRPLVLFIVDPVFLKTIGFNGGFYHGLFLIIVVLNLVAGFQALGSLMAVGLLVLPAIVSQLWARSLEGMFICTLLTGISASYFGLIFSYHFDIPSGPAIIGSMGIFYLISLMFGAVGGVISRIWRYHHKGH